MSRQPFGLLTGIDCTESHEVTSVSATNRSCAGESSYRRASHETQHRAGVGGGIVSPRECCPPNGPDVKLQAAHTRERTSGAQLAAQDQPVEFRRLTTACTPPPRPHP